MYLIYIDLQGLISKTGLYNYIAMVCFKPKLKLNESNHKHKDFKMKLNLIDFELFCVCI